MQISFTVHSNSVSPVPTVVQYEGKDLTVDVPMRIVELVNDQMTHTLKAMPGADADELEGYEEGATVTATFAAAGKTVHPSTSSPSEVGNLFTGGPQSATV